MMRPRRRCMYQTEVEDIKNHFKGHTRVDILAKLVFNAAIWFIWNERNERIPNDQKRHKLQLFDPLAEAIKIKMESVNTTCEVSISNRKILEMWHCTLHKKNKIEPVFTWTKPEQGWLKLNSNGPVEMSNSSFGGVLQDASGNLICCYNQRTSIQQIHMVESKGALEGLTISRQLLGNEIKVWLEKDSLLCYKWIGKKCNPLWYARIILTHIWSIEDNLQAFNVSFSWREANRAADFLSKLHFSHPLSSVAIYRPNSALCTNELIEMLNEDATSKAYKRKCNL